MSGITRGLWGEYHLLFTFIYMLRLTTILICVILIACNSKQAALSNEKINELKEYHIQKSKEGNYQIDSFRFVQLEPLTKRHQLATLIEITNEEVEDMQSWTKSLGEEVDRLQKLVYLTSELPDTLLNQYRTELKKKQDDYEGVQEELQLLNTRNDSIRAVYDKADSVKTIAFRATSFVQLKRPDNSVIRDTLHAYLNLAKDIIREEEYLKIR